jgi:16S rRNA (guanine966-N2)-methyltransferase
VAKSFKLATPSDIIRPTSILLKRRYFDSTQKFEGFEFVDLCAGTGAMGLEALSRGANKVYLNEAHSKVFQVLKKNVNSYTQKFGEQNISLSKNPFPKFLKSYQPSSDSILFFDPPYEKVELYKEYAEYIKGKEYSQNIIEFCRQKTLPEQEMKNLFGEPERIYQQGTSFLYIYVL